MARIHKVVLIHAPTEWVWEVLCNADRLPEWNEELVDRFEVTAAEYLKGREIEAKPPFMNYARGRDRLEPREAGTEVRADSSSQNSFSALHTARVSHDDLRPTVPSPRSARPSSSRMCRWRNEAEWSAFSTR